MFFILSKTIYIILMPIFWLILGFLYAFWVKNPQRKKRAFLGVFILFIVLTNPFIINSLLLLWETPPTQLKDLKDTYEVGIVLTGITRYQKSPHDRTYLDAGADRIMHALWLYRAGKIKKILITGASVDIYNNTRPSEAKSLAEILKQAQVPDSVIVIEEQARNTRENALHTQYILQKRFPQQKYLLITSGFHMRRALGCFKKVGLEVQPFSAGFYTFDWAETNFGAFVPSEKAFSLWYLLIHEMVGYIVYMLIGYI